MTPTENDTTSPRVVRGGGWFNYVAPSWVRAASRGTVVPAYPVTDVGFRTTLAGKMKR